ncbi:MAG: DUF86 domain-containing protein [Elusimicrobia bacterium]|nr:DUF86 domain-containing protein [Elusimicrobiota bacterium]
MKSDKVRLKHILDAMEVLMEYAAEGHDLFTRDRKTRLAMIHLVQMIGQAAGSLSPSLKEKTLEILWKQMGVMRNVLVHEYFAVDDELVWDVAIKDILVIQGKIKTLWESLPEEKEG